MKNQYIRKRLPKKGGAFAVCRFKGAWQKRGGGILEGSGYPNAHYDIRKYDNENILFKLKTVKCFWNTSDTFSNSVVKSIFIKQINYKLSHFQIFLIKIC